MKQIIYLFLFVFLFSCGNNKETTDDNTQEKPKLSIVQQHSTLEKVAPEYEKEVENWQELKSVNSFIQKFEKVSPNEALTNALELRDLVLNLKDSLKPTLFQIPSFDARVNVLYNETLRLADITLIPAITAKEVNVQITKTIDACSSVNSKINIILSKKRFEDAIDVNFDFIGIDSTKMDSISKKSINKKKEEELFLKNHLNQKVPNKKE